MSVQSQIDRITDNLDSTYNVLNEAGATMPQTRNSANLAGTAASISAVLYSKAQSLSDAQKQQARANLGVVGTVTPQDYGAKGNGTTDDTAAFQNALANNRVVFVPGGEYKLSGELIIGSNCQLELSQDAVLYFTQTAGNCISLHYCSWLKGNHATVSVPYGFTGNVVNIDTGYTESITNVPPFKKWDPMWKPNRFITDLNIVKPDTRGFYYSMDGSCNGTALFINCDGNDLSTFLWGLELTGLRIAGAFTYGIHGVVSNLEGDDGWNHEMKIDGIIAGCETGVKLENVNNVYLSAIVQPIKAMNTNEEVFPYCKYGVYLDNCKQADLSGYRVWDWDSDKTLWNEGNEYQHLVMIGNCMGAILNEFYYYGNPDYDIRTLIYTDTPSNLEKMTILQEPFTRWFKPKDFAPYFFDGDFEKKLVLQEELNECIQAERTANFTNAIPTAINKDGTIFDGVGYAKHGKRWNFSDGTLLIEPSNGQYYGSTGLISIKKGDTVRVKGMRFYGTGGFEGFVVFDANFNRIISATSANVANMTYYFDYAETDEGFTVKVKETSAVAYIAFTFYRELIGVNPIISVNNPITYSQSGYLTDGIKVKSQNVEGLAEILGSYIDDVDALLGGG